MANYNSTHTGAQIDNAVNKALNPDTTPTTNSSQLITSGGVKAAIDAEQTRAQNAEALLAPKASPALTGSPTAPTPPTGNDSTRIATTAFVQANVNAVKGLAQYTLLAEGADLNDVLDVGVYACSSATRAQSLLNCPSTYAFTMFVTNIGGGGRIQEISTPYHNFRRYYFVSETSSGFTEWTSSVFGIYIPEGSDLDTYTEQGFYYCNHSNLVNSPTSDYFSLLVMRLGSTTYNQVLITPRNVYTRYVGSQTSRWRVYTPEIVGG